MLWMRVCERLFERQRCVGDGGRERERESLRKRDREREMVVACVYERERGIESGSCVDQRSVQSPIGRRRRCENLLGAI